MRVVFMGTPEYAARSLAALLAHGYDVAGVFTQPDRPKGRGGKVAMSPVKEMALERGIPVFQPRRIRLEGAEDLRGLSPDVCVTAAFGQILSQEILDVPRLGTVNVHASLLPKYRGSSPVQWALIMGETHTGVTTMMTDRGIDTGDVLLREGTDILPGETAGELALRLADLGAALLIRTLRLLEAGECPREPQDERDATYYPMLRKDHGAVDWGRPARDIANLVRGTNPWPGAYAESPWGTLKILEARAENGGSRGTPGAILVAGRPGALNIATGDGTLSIQTLQAPGGRAMPAGDFLRGHPIPQGATMRNGEKTDDR